MVEWESPTIHFHLVQFSFHFRQSPKIQFQEKSPTLLLSLRNSSSTYAKFEQFKKASRKISTTEGVRIS